MLFLVADLGGTNCRFAICTAEGAQFSLMKEQWFETQDFSSMAELLHALKNTEDFLTPEVEYAVFAVAGPVEGPKCYPPNIEWDVDSKDIRAALNIPSVTLLNDFAAQGFGCLLIQGESQQTLLDVVTIWPGQPGVASAFDPLAVVGAGSGFGKAMAIPAYRLVLPSEGGHAEFPFTSDEEWEYAQFLRERLGLDKLVGDDVLNGDGLALLYAFHSSKVNAKIAKGKEDAVAKTALRWYARFYGRFCRNFMLDVSPKNGLYISGGVATYMPVLSQPEFLEELHESETHADFLKKIPVHHIRSPKAGLLGAACFAVLKNLSRPT